jgi:hypothetical protein
MVLNPDAFWTENFGNKLYSFSTSVLWSFVNVMSPCFWAPDDGVVEPEFKLPPPYRQYPNKEKPHECTPAAEAAPLPAFVSSADTGRQIPATIIIMHNVNTILCEKDPTGFTIYFPTQNPMAGTFHR